MSSPDEEKCQALSAFVRAHEEHALFSGNVLVALGNKIIFQQSYGLANRELMVSNEYRTKFRIASCTKQFCAATVLILVQRGLLQLHETVDRWFPLQSRASEIMLHHLLSNSSGIPNVTEVEGGDSPTFWRIRRDPQQLLAPIHPLPLIFDPGSSYAYSNTNFIMLSYIVSVVSGTSWHDFLQSNILDPLGMSDTGVDDPARLLSHRANGYSYDARRYQNGHWEDPWSSQGAGSMYSTANDLFKWSRGLLHTDLILSPEMRAQMLHRHTVRARDCYYGYGLRVEQTPTGDLKLAHSGSCWSAFSSRMEMCPEGEGACVVVLANCGNADVEGIAAGLGSILLHGPAPYHPEARTIVQLSDYSRFLGHYELQDPHRGVRYHLRITPDSEAEEDGVRQKVTTLDMIRENGVNRRRAILGAKEEGVFWLLDQPEKMVFVFERGRVIGWSEPWTTAIKLD